MKIKFYIVTYNSNEILNDWILKSLHESDYDRDNVEIFVIDNHSNVEIKDEYKSFAKILANNLRPNFSSGHLARNHNQAIINGFESLVEPKCDVVVSCQNDTKVVKNWYQLLCGHMQKYSFLTNGAGDQFQAWTPDGVKNIGLYDERFCTIGFQEADYFLRAFLYNKDKTSLNDQHHGRMINRSSNVISRTQTGAQRKAFRNKAYYELHKFNHSILKKKWGVEYDQKKGIHWKRFTNLDQMKCLIDNYVMYPYFEKDINDLKGKRYI